jgi:hypothetical protein
MDENWILSGGTKNKAITFVHPVGPLRSTNQPANHPTIRTLLCSRQQILFSFCVNVKLY